MKLTVLFGTLGGLLVLAFVANRLFRRTRIPDVVVLMATGLVLGPILGWADASRFEGIAHAFGTLAVILILFEGGLELDIRGTLRHFPGGLLLGVLGYGVTLALVTPVVWWTLRLPLFSALLVGAVVSCTSSAVVLPTLQQLEARPPLKVTLLIEASLGDVLGVLTVGILLDIYAFGGSLAGEFFRRIFSEVTVSLLMALVAGYLWSRLLPVLSEQRFWQVLTFSVVLLLYAGSEALMANGLIAVLGFGLTLANFPGIDQRLLQATLAAESPAEEHHLQILTFHSELAFLVRTFFFVLLGVVVKVGGLGRNLPTIMGILGALLVARWLAVQGSRWSWREIDSRDRELVFWLLPRGLITAVLAIQVLEARGSEFAALPTLAFAVILVTNLLVLLGTVRVRQHPAVSAPAPTEAAVPPAS
jgi:cell volume regulation protein A